MSIPIYSFDGKWWYSLNGQLKPLPEMVKNRDEAKVEAVKAMEFESDGKGNRKRLLTFSFNERSLAPCTTNEGTKVVLLDSEGNERTVVIPEIEKGE